MKLEVMNADSTDPIFLRLEDQIAWYEKKGAQCKRWYMRLRIISLISAAVIPITSTFAFPYLTSALGVVIVIIEGIQQINGFHENWIQYRGTAESLKHEKYLFLAEAGPYRAANDARQLLAERVEDRVSTEHNLWMSEQVRPQRSQTSADAVSPKS
jgi:hypothetical protein